MDKTGIVKMRKTILLTVFFLLCAIGLIILTWPTARLFFNPIRAAQPFRKVANVATVSYQNEDGNFFGPKKSETAYTELKDTLIVTIPNSAKITFDDTSGTNFPKNMSNTVFTETVIKGLKPAKSSQDKVEKIILTLGSDEYKKEKLYGVKIIVKKSSDNSKALAFMVDSDENGWVVFSPSNLDKSTYDFVINVPKRLTKLLPEINLNEFDSVPIDARDLLIGNLDDSDDKIDDSDRELLLNVWGMSEEQADLNHDNVINNIDWSIMNSNWNKVGDLTAI